MSKECQSNNKVFSKVAKTTQNLLRYLFAFVVSKKKKKLKGLKYHTVSKKH